MAINFNSFTEGTTAGGATPIQTNDYVVGFDTAVPGGERKWPITTLAQSVSSVITPELINKISQNSGAGTVTSVTGTSPIVVANGTTTPAISIAAATTSAAGSMSSTDKTRLDDASGVNGIVKCNGSGDFSAAVAGTDYPTGIQGAKAWVNFDGTTTSANLGGTYSQSGTTVTVTTSLAHDLSQGQEIYVNITSGTGVDGEYTVATITSPTVFTYTAGTSLTTSGNITLIRSSIRSDYNVSSVTKNGTGNYTINFTTPMANANYACVLGGNRDGSPITGINCFSSSSRTINSVNISTAASSSGATNFVYVELAVFSN